MQMTTQSERDIQLDIWVRAVTARATIVFQASKTAYTAAECVEFADRIVQEYNKRA